MPPFNSGHSLIKKNGFNLIEAAIVLGIVGLVIGAIWIAASAVRFNTILNQTVQEITMTLNCARGILQPTDSSSDPPALLQNIGCLYGAAKRSSGDMSGPKLETSSGWVHVFLNGDGKMTIQTWGQSLEMRNRLATAITAAYRNNPEILTLVTAWYMSGQVDVAPPYTNFPVNFSEGSNSIAFEFSIPGPGR